MKNDTQTANVSNMDFKSLVSRYFEAMSRVEHDYTEAEIYFDEIAQRCYKERKMGVKYHDSYYILEHSSKLLRYLSTLEA
jgi:hypothetical protein